MKKTIAIHLTFHGTPEQIQRCVPAAMDFVKGHEQELSDLMAVCLVDANVKELDELPD